MNQERFRDNLIRVARRRVVSRTSRRGFTLVELLMVIVVIGVLSSLLVVASMSVLGNAREAATKATLSKINTMLKERMSAFETHMTNLINGDIHLTLGAPDERSGKILLRNREFKKYFPQSWSEATDIAAAAGVTPQTAPSTSATEIATESAEVLYMMLTKTTLTGQGEIGQDAFSSSELADKDGDGRKELVDSWGTPLRFYRWPCRLIKPSASSPTDNPSAAELKAARTQISALTTDTADKAINSDPDDPYDLASSISTFANDYHFRKTYHTPLVVSAGIDALFGLESPIDSNVDNRQAKPTANTAELYDNLTNLNALAGGSQ
ncbi:MAG: type II secretion system protein [Planctomycetaceae bacterium]|nr:type II secretion system protein [Planctomycetaceae bacterium]